MTRELSLQDEEQPRESIPCGGNSLKSLRSVILENRKEAGGAAAGRGGVRGRKGAVQEDTKGVGRG